MSKPSTKTKRIILISGISVVCLLSAVFIIGSWNKEDPKPVSKIPATQAPTSVTINVPKKQPADHMQTLNKQESVQPTPSSKPSSPPVVVPEIKEQPTVTDMPVLQPEVKEQHVEVPITTPKKTPKPTETPKPKPKTSTVQKNKSTSPSNGKKVSQPAKKEKSEPKAGDKNSKGQVWFPGFGWVEDSGPNQGTTANDMYENGNKIGNMD